MPFRRFFDRGAKHESPVVDEPSAAEAEAPEEEIELAEEESDSDETYTDEEGAPEDAAEVDWFARAAAILPTGASTGSKRLEALYGDASAAGPTHFVSASGCRFVDPLGQTYIDCTMALGAVALGYAEVRVQRADGAHDQLDVTRLEELNRGEPALDVDIGALEVFGGRRRGELLCGRDPARGVAGGEMQLIQPEQCGLREVQRRMLGGGNHDGGVHPVEYVVR